MARIKVNCERISSKIKFSEALQLHYIVCFSAQTFDEETGEVKVSDTYCVFDTKEFIEKLVAFYNEKKFLILDVSE